MVDRARPIRLVRSNNTANGGKHIMVSERGLLSLPVPFVQVLEFDAQDARLNRIEAAVISFDIVEILSRLAEGYNGRLDSIQAGILSVKLQHLDEWNRERQQAALRYHDMFSSVGSVIPPYQPDWSRAVYHLYVIRVQDREGLRKHLAEANVDTGVHYPLPLHLQRAYANLGGKQGDFPITERISSEILSLPMYPRLEAEQQRRIVQKIVEFVAVASLP